MRFCRCFPTTVKELRQVLGQFSYYRQFIPRFASIAEPLTSALKATDQDKAALVGLDSRQRARRMGRLVVTPTPERIAALDRLKYLLSSAPVLRYPVFSQPFFLYTDDRTWALVLLSNRKVLLMVVADRKSVV